MIGNFGPHEHRAFRRRDVPPGRVQPLDQSVAAFAIDFDDLGHHVIAVAQGDDGRDLNRLEHAVIEVAFDPGQGSDRLAVTDAEAHPPPGHRVTLRHREHLDRHVLRPWRLQDARRLVAVESQIGVRQIVDDQIAALARYRDGLLEELLLNADRRRVVREREYKELGLLRTRVIEPAKRIYRGFRPTLGALADRQFDQFAARDGRGEGMDRVARVGNDYPVARLDQRHHQVREALFRADGRDRLGLGIDFDAVATRVPSRDFDAQIGNASRGRISVISRIARGLDQFVDYRIGRGQIRIAHAQIDNVLAAVARLHFQMIDEGKNIRWKFFDERKSIVHRKWIEIRLYCRFLRQAPGYASLPARQASIYVRLIEAWRAGSDAYPEIFRRRSAAMSSSHDSGSEFNNPNLEILITAGQLQSRIREMGAEITRDYAGRRPELICVLKGAMLFMSDLMRAIDLNLSIDFIAVSSYDKGKSSTGEVKIVKDLDEPLEGRDIILVEDILDTGLTLNYLVNNFRSRGATSTRIATLLNKPDRRRVVVTPDYCGFTIPDKFVVGYGLDYAERYRNLPYIGAVKE